MAKALSIEFGFSIWVQSISARFTAPVRPSQIIEVTTIITKNQKTNIENWVECSITARVGERIVAIGNAMITNARSSKTP